MVRLPVIVGFGGFNAAGRSSFHQAYQRTVVESLPVHQRQETLAGLAVMMGLVAVEQGEYRHPLTHQTLSLGDIEAQFGAQINQGTLIREIGTDYFDVNQVPQQQAVPLANTDVKQFVISLPKRQLPAKLPANWQILADEDYTVRIQISGDVDLSLASHRVSPVQSAGQLPSGFAPDTLYPSRFHPRALQLAIIGASDAVNSLGIDWQTIMAAVAPDEISAYSSSVMSQLDHNGLGGLLQARLRGDRATTKQLPLGLGSMPNDFVNAYVLGNMGVTGSIAGACASFLFNLRAGIEDIQSGRRRVVVVGSSEAPILPEVIEGFGAMSALATVERLQKLADHGDDLRRSSRPFGDNCGFVIAESTQHVVLMDDALALELGADIYGAVPSVYTHADGFKKSISAPGPGNYLTLGKAVASACDLLGNDVVARRSFVQAHGSSTPQNRVSESHILNHIAQVFGISHWPVTAVKAFVGHSLAPASGDQLVSSLGVFAQGILPGIKTINQLADDVVTEHLDILLQDTHKDDLAVAFLNSKGFGGNNATATVISPKITQSMLAKRHGQPAMAAYQKRLEATRAQAQAYHQSFLKGEYQTIYHFGQNMIAEDELNINRDHISVPGYEKAVDLLEEKLYKDMV